MNPTALLSKLTSYLKYQRYLPALGRKETWNETIDRNKEMHLHKYRHILRRNSHLLKEIETAYSYIRDYKILPSMRSMQFGGTAILTKETRMYNCCYVPIKDVVAFRETMFLLLCGTGVGYSVQDHHVGQLPPIYKPIETKEYYISDSIEGWADAVHALIDAYMPTDYRRRYIPVFNGSIIRPKGSLIRSIGSIAPGPENLLECLDMVKEMFEKKVNGSGLAPLEVSDILNIFSECVMAGGVRRSAMICLFSPSNSDVLMAKTGNWFIGTPWRARSNNSAIIIRGSEREKLDFERVWSILSAGGYGEPGIYFSNDREWGTNPCVETALAPHQFCNLTEINGSTVESQDDLNKRVHYATLLGTLQAGYTNFTYLTDRWQKSTKKDALLGVGITGIAHGRLDQYSLADAARQSFHSNFMFSRTLNIKSASRLTCVKPSGTTSLVLGCTSGIHAAHSPYYIRRIRIGKQEPIYQYLATHLPNCVEDEIGATGGGSGVISVPQKIENLAGTAYRNEHVYDFLHRIRHYNQEWVAPGHIHGSNKHNVSATVSVKDDEWNMVKEWLWRYRENYTGIACLPYTNSGYAQMPFEECTKSTYEHMLNNFRGLNLDNVKLKEQGSEISIEPACSGGLCER